LITLDTESPIGSESADEMDESLANIPEVNHRLEDDSKYNNSQVLQKSS